MSGPALRARIHRIPWFRTPMASERPSVQGLGTLCQSPRDRRKPIPLLEPRKKLGGQRRRAVHDAPDGTRHRANGVHVAAAFGDECVQGLKRTLHKAQRAVNPGDARFGRCDPVTQLRPHLECLRRVSSRHLRHGDVDPALEWSEFAMGSCGSKNLDGISYRARFGDRGRNQHRALDP